MYTKECRNNLKTKSVLKLDNFLTKEAIVQLQKEAIDLRSQAFYCSQKHTILLGKKNDSLSKDDPCNIEVKSDKGCVPHDLIPINSHLNKIYRSIFFKKFIRNVLNVQNIFPYKDNLSSINYNYYEQSQQLGWHFDNASFAITLMIDSPNEGGEFQYLNKGRDFANNYIDKKLINNVLVENKSANTLKAKPGTLILFYGRDYLHRVTPVISKKNRVLVTLNYNLEKNVILSKNARLTFFGRLN
jgi:hypothetical protein